MTKQVFVPILLVIAYIIGLGLFTKYVDEGKIKITSPIKSSQANPISTPEPIKTVAITNQEDQIITLQVEIANTPALRKQGLSGRSNLDSNEGLLFTFPQKAQPPFWMKDMNFPIDIIWISDNKIAQIHKSVPAPDPNTPESQLQLYTPNDPINYVLEAVAGFAEQNNISPGDTIQLPN